MNSENSKSTDPHRLILDVTDKINLKRSEKYVALSNLSIYYTLKNIKRLYKNNKFKNSAPTWNDKLTLPDGSYSASDTWNYIEYIIKKRETVTDNTLIRVHVNLIENRITFKIKTGYYLETLTPEIMELLRSTKNKITKDKNGEIRFI